jgi:hypothetical protein
VETHARDDGQEFTRVARGLERRRP